MVYVERFLISLLVITLEIVSSGCVENATSSLINLENSDISNDIVVVYSNAGSNVAGLISNATKSIKKIQLKQDNNVFVVYPQNMDEDDKTTTTLPLNDEMTTDYHTTVSTALIAEEKDLFVDITNDENARNSTNDEYTTKSTNEFVTNPTTTQFEQNTEIVTLDYEITEPLIKETTETQDVITSTTVMPTTIMNEMSTTPIADTVTTSTDYSVTTTTIFNEFDTTTSNAIDQTTVEEIKEQQQQTKSPSRKTRTRKMKKIPTNYSRYINGKTSLPLAPPVATVNNFRPSKRRNHDGIHLFELYNNEISAEKNLTLDSSPLTTQKRATLLRQPPKSMGFIHELMLRNSIRKKEIAAQQKTKSTTTFKTTPTTNIDKFSKIITTGKPVSSIRKKFTISPRFKGNPATLATVKAVTTTTTEKTTTTEPVGSSTFALVGDFDVDMSTEWKSMKITESPIIKPYRGKKKFFKNKYLEKN